MKNVNSRTDLQLRMHPFRTPKCHLYGMANGSQKYPEIVFCLQVAVFTKRKSSLCFCFDSFVLILENRDPLARISNIVFT